ncbi:sigma-70 family RNA polymerase sigma factor [Paraburkholderia tropica]|uniref:sigma-70 family RNA polymerase sigma factor n=1 Tax=Paraburkholderia tropica TaxID=92647 RepID=UPI002AB62BF1|nr:sigma-70 family RNA polymerase sigma factor [Paraburkholderia tropica]
MSAAEFPVQKTLHSLYSDHHGWLRSWLHARLGNSADAADLAQDTFLRLLRRSSWPAIDDAANARAYLRATAQNLCVNLWRRQEIERAWLETLAANPEATYPSAERQAIVLEALEEISAMLYALPGNATQAFLMAVACEMTDDEVGAHMGISGRMVRKHVAKVMLACLQLQAGNTVRVLREDGER